MEIIYFGLSPGAYVVPVNMNVNFGDMHKLHELYVHNIKHMLPFFSSGRNDRFYTLHICIFTKIIFLQKRLFFSI